MSGTQIQKLGEIKENIQWGNYAKSCTETWMIKGSGDWKNLFKNRRLINSAVRNH